MKELSLFFFWDGSNDNVRNNVPSTLTSTVNGCENSSAFKLNG